MFIRHDAFTSCSSLSAWQRGGTYLTQGQTICLQFCNPGAVLNQISTLLNQISTVIVQISTLIVQISTALNQIPTVPNQICLQLIKATHTPHILAHPPFPSKSYLSILSPQITQTHTHTAAMPLDNQEGEPPAAGGHPPPALILPGTRDNGVADQHRPHSASERAHNSAECAPNSEGHSGHAVSDSSVSDCQPSPLDICRYRARPQKVRHFLIFEVVLWM